MNVFLVQLNSTVLLVSGSPLDYMRMCVYLCVCVCVCVCVCAPLAYKTGITYYHNDTP